MVDLGLWKQELILNLILNFGTSAPKDGQFDFSATRFDEQAFEQSME
jgi:hypothetical protein